LADAFYLYALALNRSFEMYGSDWVVDGEALMKNSAGEFFGNKAFSDKIRSFFRFFWNLADDRQWRQTT
jgi:hypothetical protein